MGQGVMNPPTHLRRIPRDREHSVQPNVSRASKQCPSPPYRCTEVMVNREIIQGGVG
jgi:hypothetical protein